MLYPGNEEGRDAYQAAVVHRHMIAENPGQPVPAAIANLTFQHGGEPGVMKRSERAFSQALLAGETLFMLLKLATSAPEKATIRKAQWLVENFRRHPKITGSRTSIETAWSKFKNVSHLWAAFIDLWIVSDADPHLLDDNELPNLLSGARWFANAATSHYPPSVGSKAKPVLDPKKIWAIPNSPDIPTVELELPPLSDKEHNALSEYRHD
jgi:hypothetical protein